MLMLMQFSVVEKRMHRQYFVCCPAPWPATANSSHHLPDPSMCVDEHGCLSLNGAMIKSEDRFCGMATQLTMRPMYMCATGQHPTIDIDIDIDIHPPQLR